MSSEPTVPISLSLVIPLYNEVDSIAQTLHDACEALQSTGAATEIIVVDDGSTDGSAQAVEETGLPVRVIRHESNRGYGAALKTGIAAACYEYVAIVDADGSYPVRELPNLMQAAPDHAMVVGERIQYSHYSSSARNLGKAILVPLANYLSGIKIPDINSGMRIMRKDLVERYWPLLPDTFSFTTTITLSLLCAGWNVRYLPIQYAKREGHSKIKPVRDMIRFVILIVRTSTYFRPLKVYLPIGFGFIFIALALLLVRVFYGHVLNITTLFFFIAGLQSILVGVLADLILKLLGTRK
ncbi:TPA: glycosyltransferase family 2 protein [Candidatus Sumerlaeota bacterium]|jgi:glycosyltransferase involved in cell wall biosynthesis|nr:glycosyltransferase family 2 protein [Candidatus Sumerlaeota bacterium]